MDTPTREAATLNRAVAAEIRALLARKQIRQAAFATQLGQDEVWVSRRLRAVVPMSLNDLEAMCRALRVEPADLIASAIREAQPSNHGNSPPPVRPKDTRPPGRADQRVSTPSGIRRPRRVRVLDAVPLTGSAA